jgi:hypothetical protein
MRKGLFSVVAKDFSKTEFNETYTILETQTIHVQHGLNAKMCFPISIYDITAETKLLKPLFVSRVPHH